MEYRQLGHTELKVSALCLGATTLDQLAHNIASADLHLSEVVLSAIDEIHHDNPNPCP